MPQNFEMDENCWSSVLKFPPPHGPVLTKISKCHKSFKFFADHQNIYNFLFSHDHLIGVKVGLDRIVGAVAF